MCWNIVGFIRSSGRNQPGRGDWGVYFTETSDTKAVVEAEVLWCGGTKGGCLDL